MTDELRKSPSGPAVSLDSDNIVNDSRPGGGGGGGCGRGPDGTVWRGRGGRGAPALAVITAYL